MAPVFDPPMAQHANAMRVSEPHVADPDVSYRWRRALDLVL
ncbi:hypothetical protein Pme01_60360 [Planosporangium mesophilum]|uniref:Uncharacterized protein n=1 Tax=Planosporangium mesophilum TaxID=689768 RepID=A0A8J3THN3_9ACTN|nr:hypothetical protein Pme01_60360 [Planosporangium mesophilum]